MNPACSATRKQITILGINSLFGQTVSFLLKQSPIANRLVLYDESDTEVAHDLSAINTTCKLVVYNGEEQLRCAVKVRFRSSLQDENSDLILIGDKEDPGPNVDETIGKAAPDVIKYAEAISYSAPNAIVLVAASPVNSMLSLFSEVQIRNGTFDGDRVMGVTSVDTMRASTVLARHMNLDPEKVYLPVIGGSSPDTRIPLFSQSRPSITVCKADLRKMTRMVKLSECELFKLLNRGDALNKAYATVRLMDSVMSALRGQRNISEIVLSRTCLVPDVDYFSLPVILGPKGIAHRFPIPKLTERENVLLLHATKFMEVDKQKAVDLVHEKDGNHQCPTPEKTKEYSDLIDCDRKGIFVGDLLDRLKIRKETCKPKLEYLLMNKNNDLVYPPDCEPSLSPKRLKFVEPDPLPNDGCCPVKLPSPPSPPKRGLTVLTPAAPKKCKIVSSPCPYPPVVKSPKTCRVCEKLGPCEHYDGCKNLYGDVKCCSKALSLSENKLDLISKSEQQEAQLTPSPSQPTDMSKETNVVIAGVEHQLVVTQQISCIEQTPDKVQHSSMPQSNTSELPHSTANHSIPLISLDSGNVKSTDTSDVHFPNMESGTHSPYGMSVSSQTFECSHSLPVSELSSEKTVPINIEKITKGYVTESDGMSQFKPVNITQFDFNKRFPNADCHNTVPPPRNIDQSIDRCLSKICLVGMNHHVSAPRSADTNLPAQNDLVNATDSSKGGSGLKTAEQSDIHLKAYAKAPKEFHSQVENKSPSTSGSQHAAAESNSAQPIMPNMSNNVLPVQDTSKTQNTVCEQGNNSDGIGSVQQALPNKSSNESFNYSGGFGITTRPSERNPSNPLISFNSWSARREELYYNEQLAHLKNKPQKEDKASKDIKVTENSNEKQTCEITNPEGTDNVNHRIPIASKENKCGNDSHVQNIRGPGIGSNSGVSCNSNVRPDLVKSDGLNENGRKDLILHKTVSILCRTVGQISSKENKMFADKDWKINALVSNMRMHENIRASIENVKIQNDSKSKAERSKVLGFGQMISALIPSRRSLNRTDGKSHKMGKLSRTHSRKLYFEKLNKHQPSDTKEQIEKATVLPIAPPMDHKDRTKNRTNNISRSSAVDPEISRIAMIRFRVQQALKSVMYPPKYNRKSTERISKAQKPAERILQDKLRRASKAMKENEREVGKIDSPHAPVSHKSYAPKCPHRLLFGNHPDSRVVTFYNVGEFDIPTGKMEKVCAGERIAGCDDIDRTMKISPEKVEGSSHNSSTVREVEITSDSRPPDHHFNVKTDVTDSDKITSAIHEYYHIHDSDCWNHRPHQVAYLAPPPTSSQQSVQNQPVSISLKSTIVPEKVKESSFESSTVCVKTISSENGPPDQYFNVKTDVTATEKTKSAVHEYPDIHDSDDSWTHRPFMGAHRAPPPTSNPEVVQNQPASIRLKSTKAQTNLNNEDLNYVPGRRTIGETRNEFKYNHSESIKREKSKKVTTPGRIRLARVDDPKYGLTSPNRRTSNR